MQAFGIGVLASLVVAVAYALFIGQREAQIRAYLKDATSGFSRRLYVGALVQAVRGDAAVADSRRLAILSVVIVALTALTLRVKTGDLDGRMLEIQERLHQVSLDALHPPDRKELDQRLVQQLQASFDLFQRIKAEMTWVSRGLGIVAPLCSDETPVCA